MGQDIRFSTRQLHKKLNYSTLDEIKTECTIFVYFCLYFVYFCVFVFVILSFDLNAIVWKTQQAQADL